MEKHGIFINHKHDQRYLAGRIYDYFTGKGVNPFLDTHSIGSGNYFEPDIIREINSTPYFLCVLTPGAWNQLDESSVYYAEIETALKNKDTAVFVIVCEGFRFPDALPPALEEMRGIQYCTLLNDMSNFFAVMDQLYAAMDLRRLEDVLDWKSRSILRGETLVLSRSEMESEIATLSSRFGKELIECVDAKKPFEGVQTVRRIRMSCYAASIIFTPNQNMLDEQAYDRGRMFNIFSELLKDEDFSLEIIINAPGSVAMKDVIVNRKHGNSSQEGTPEAIFYGSYAGISQLTKEDPIFRKAAGENRFRFMVTENILPYAIFQIDYKKGWEKYNHVKVDLYSEGIVSTMERRSLLFFADTDKENYEFFRNRYKYIRNPEKSLALIRRNHGRWIRKWKRICARKRKQLKKKEG